MSREPESPAEPNASRARALAAGDETRRRIQRNLHDGAQQELVNAVLALKLARHELTDATGPAVELLDEAIAHTVDVSRELHELSDGILPASPAPRGLRVALEALMVRVRVPVAVEVTNRRLPGAVEAAAHFIIAEALANTTEHARAQSARVVAVIDGDLLRLEVHDDGVGGASASRGTGLLGLRDRAAALGGDLAVESPRGGGTLVSATLPIAAAQAA